MDYKRDDIDDAIDILNRMKSISNDKRKRILDNFFRKMKIKKIINVTNK